jgi:hypothetical protein
VGTPHDLIRTHPYSLVFFTLISLSGIAGQIGALELYRCSENGHIEFRQTPCPSGEQAKTQVVEQSRGMTPAEPALRLEPHKKPRNKTGPAPATAGKANAERCWKTEQRLKRIEQRLRAGYKASQYGKLHRAQAEYEEYLKRFCQ